MTCDDGINPPIVWSPSASAKDAKSALDELVAAVGGGTWWQASRSSTEAGMDATIYTGTAYTVTANSTAQSLFGFPASQGPTVAATCGPVVGTIFCALPTEGELLRRWWRSIDGEGEPGLIASVPGTSARRPLLSMPLDAIEASRLTQILARAASPRTAYYADDGGAASPTWRALTLGPVSRSRLSPVHWLADLEVRG
ncbi:MAG: hypothetical protein H6747_09585 [Deltaproteobacteria bacterium]|nr:hypothetical protein [Deltaproteobacteria bacterium]